jgi:hypothetical protein
MRKLSYKIWDCDFIGYTCNSSCYRLIIIKHDVLDYNTIIKSKIAIFFEHVFHLKNKEKFLHKSSVTSNKFFDDIQELRRSKRARKKGISVMILLLILLMMIQHVMVK